MFIEPTITRALSGLSGYIWLDTKIVFEKNKIKNDTNEKETNKRLNQSIIKTGEINYASVAHLEAQQNSLAISCIAMSKIWVSLRTSLFCWLSAT